MSEKQAKKNRQEQEKGQKQVRLVAKIKIPKEKLAEFTLKLDEYRYTEKKDGDPEKIKNEIVEMAETLISEGFNVGIKMGRQLQLKEIQANAGLVKKQSGLVVPSHIAAERQKDQS